MSVNTRSSGVLDQPLSENIHEGASAVGLAATVVPVVISLYEATNGNAAAGALTALAATAFCYSAGYGRSIGRSIRERVSNITIGYHFAAATLAAASIVTPLHTVSSRADNTSATSHPEWMVMGAEQDVRDCKSGLKGQVVIRDGHSYRLLCP